jgi:hypothetical protein
MLFRFEKFFSEATLEKTEEIILNSALVSFFIHFTVICILKFDFITLSSNLELLKKNLYLQSLRPFLFFLFMNFIY